MLVLCLKKQSMAAKPLQMHQIRRILELVIENYSTRKIAQLTSIARRTISEYRHLILATNIPLTDLLKCDDETLSAIVYHKSTSPLRDIRWQYLETRIPDLLLELKRTGVTRKLLWEEYRNENPDGYGYTQFCDHLASQLRIRDAVMHFHHTPGDQLEVDFAGDKLNYVDSSTGEIIPCEVLVCTLPFSQYAYIEAIWSQKQEHFIKALSNALYFFGGVPKSIKTDNMRTAVVKSDRYEPKFTEAMEFFGNYYGTTVLAARVRKPRDKPSVENAVVNTYRRIYAPLRNIIFTGREELNQALHLQMEKFNSAPFQKKEHSRKLLFEMHEKSVLKSLPDLLYEIRRTTKSKVQKNYHVILGEDWHQYSVPYTLIGKELKLIYTSDWVEIYHEQKRVAIHKRNLRKYGYTTLTAHMPANHVFIAEARGWDAPYFLKKAKLIGINTHDYIQRILSSKSFTEQTYNACLGIFRLVKQYGAQRMEAACARALNAPTANYRTIHNILMNGLDKINEPEQLQIPLHDNIRGNDTYN
jgi:transposase